MRLDVQQLCFHHGSTQTLKDISLGVADGEVLSIIGPNGSGKSTLLRCLGGIYHPSSGLVSIQGKSLRSYNRKELARQIGYVPQSSKEEQPFTVLDTILMGRRPYITWGIGKGDLEIAEHIMEELHLTELAVRFMGELSGGQKQKVLIARALAQQPSVLLLDEPTSALDIRHQLDVLEALQRLAVQSKRAIVLVMHDLSLAARYSHKLVLLKAGQVFAAGHIDQVLTPETIREVYEVESEVKRDENGVHVVPLHPAVKTSMMQRQGTRN